MLPEKSWFQRILEAAVMLAISGFLIKLAVSFVWCIRVPLIIIIVVATLGVIGYRFWRYYHGQTDWRDNHDKRL